MYPGSPDDHAFARGFVGDAGISGWRAVGRDGCSRRRPSDIIAITGPRATSGRGASNAFPAQDDDHLVGVLRYVGRNALQNQQSVTGVINSGDSNFMTTAADGGRTFGLASTGPSGVNATLQEKFTYTWTGPWPTDPAVGIDGRGGFTSSNLAIAWFDGGAPSIRITNPNSVLACVTCRRPLSTWSARRPKHPFRDARWRACGEVFRREPARKPVMESSPTFQSPVATLQPRSERRSLGTAHFTRSR